ncbi:MAG: hypothetical protein ACPG7E_03955 [Marinirhabdus sp.]
MRKKYIIGIVIIIAVLVAGIGLYNYIYQDHRDIQSEPAREELSAVNLASSFKDGVENKLLNSTVIVFGTVTEADENSVTVDERVQCIFTGGAQPAMGSSVKIKGRCIGYDDLFEIVKMDQCSVVSAQ